MRFSWTQEDGHPSGQSQGEGSTWAQRELGMPRNAIQHGWRMPQRILQMHKQNKTKIPGRVNFGPHGLLCVHMCALISLHKSPAELIICGCLHPPIVGKLASKLPRFPLASLAVSSRSALLALNLQPNLTMVVVVHCSGFPSLSPHLI